MTQITANEWQNGELECCNNPGIGKITSCLKQLQTHISIGLATNNSFYILL